VEEVVDQARFVMERMNNKKKKRLYVHRSKEEEGMS
jgi:hypothetical protein